MEPIEGPHEAAIATAGVPRRTRSRLKAALAGVAIAGMLTTWGAASVLAASPTPSASSSATASDDASDGTSDDSTEHVCPDEANGSDSSSDSSSDATAS